MGYEEQIEEYEEEEEEIMEEDDQNWDRNLYNKEYPELNKNESYKYQRIRNWDNDYKIWDNNQENNHLEEPEVNNQIRQNENENVNNTIGEESEEILYEEDQDYLEVEASMNLENPNNEQLNKE